VSPGWTRRIDGREPLVAYREVEAIVSGASSPTERRLRFAALLASALGASETEFVVVGGSAIEFYTRGQYTTGDVDVVYTGRTEVSKVLLEWRFVRQGRIWLNERLGIVLDFVKPPYTGDLTRTQALETPYGSIRLAALEDLIVKRLASAKHWRRPHDADHAQLLAAGYEDRIQWAYVERLAAQYDVEDLLAALRRWLADRRRM